MGILCKTFSFLRLSKNPFVRFLVKVSSVCQYIFQELITTFVCIDFSAPLISTSSQRQRKAVKRICSASLDKQWPEEFVLQITVLNDREFSKAKQKSNSIQEQETPGLHRESRSDCWKKILKFFDSHGHDTKCFGFEIWLAAMFKPLRNTFCWYIHMNMLQGLKNHQGLKMRHICTHKLFNRELVNDEPP